MNMFHANIIQKYYKPALPLQMIIYHHKPLHFNIFLKSNSRCLQSQQVRLVSGFTGKKHINKKETIFSKLFTNKPSVLNSNQYENDPEMYKAVLEAYQSGLQNNPNKPKVKNSTIFWIVLLLGLSYVGVKKLADFSISIQSNPTFSRLYPSPQFKVAKQIDVRFTDVKGCDEAKTELENIVSFLREPKKFHEMGAKLPKGVLLVGPPGVGKTLLARAIAGEAGVTFIHVSGSEFDEIYVGVGASRIRSLFQLARLNSPCIIFIDELDSVGRKRISSPLHPYANQTINQLLSEMDGFKQTEGILVLAATNRKEVLDNALLRPGRFDSEIVITIPRLEDRIALFHLYLSKVQREENINARSLAAGTFGFSGAEIMNVVNQAAIHASLSGRDKVTMEDLWIARDKILQGPARRRIPDEACNLNTAYHEAGHTLVSLFTKDATPLHLVTIIPRNVSLGHTSFLPDKDTVSSSLSEMKASLDVAMGGRVAEEIIFGLEKVGTGALGDFKSASDIARRIVMIYGMSEFGPRTLLQGEEISEEKKQIIDMEINRLLKESYERARTLLTAHKDDLHKLAKSLMKYETLDKEDVLTVLKGGTPKVHLKIENV